jgi:hypothetical protein
MEESSWFFCGWPDSYFWTFSCKNLMYSITCEQNVSLVKKFCCNVLFWIQIYHIADTMFLSFFLSSGLVPTMLFAYDWASNKEDIDPKSGATKTLWDRLTVVAKLMLCLPREGKTLCPSSGRRVAEALEVFRAWRRAYTQILIEIHIPCQISCNVWNCQLFRNTTEFKICVPYGRSMPCCNYKMLMRWLTQIHMIMADLFVSHPLYNTIWSRRSLPVIYLGPPPLLGRGMLWSWSVGPLITTAAAASPLSSRRCTSRWTIRVWILNTANMTTTPL